jgi:hypothetical protein
MHEKKSIAVVCIVCGATLVNGAHAPFECRPSIELCQPPAIEVPHGPHSDRSPFNPTYVRVNVAAASTSSVSTTTTWWSIPPTRK